MRLAIRKIQYAPEGPTAPPVGETTCEFVMSEKPLHMKVQLDKGVSESALRATPGLTAQPPVIPTWRADWL